MITENKTMCSIYGTFFHPIVICKITEGTHTHTHKQNNNDNSYIRAFHFININRATFIKTRMAIHSLSTITFDSEKLVKTQ